MSFLFCKGSHPEMQCAFTRQGWMQQELSVFCSSASGGTWSRDTSSCKPPPACPVWLQKGLHSCPAPFKHLLSQHCCPQHLLKQNQSSSQQETELHLNWGRDCLVSPLRKALQKVAVLYKQQLFLISSSFSSLIKFTARIY